MNKSKNIKVIITLIIVAIIAIGLFYFFPRAGKSMKLEATSLITVKVIHPKPTTNLEPITFSARIMPMESALIFARANGFVLERFVDIGDSVKEGQLLARLASPELEAEIKKARAQLILQEATIELNKNEFNRAQTLVGKGAVSKSEFDTKASQYKVSLATLDLYKAELMRLQNEFGYTEIKAPFAGHISQRNIDKGDRISNGDSIPMFKLINIEKLRVVVDVPQSQLFSIKDTTVALLTFPEFPNKTFKAKFSRIAKEIDSDSGTMRVEFILDNHDKNLQAGVSGEVQIVLTQNSEFLTIPINAMSVRDGKSSVILVDEDQRIKFQKVIAGRLRRNEVEILSGLSTQDNVVINPNALLEGGQKVRMILVS